jgi:hypothetical protein
MRRFVISAPFLTGALMTNRRTVVAERAMSPHEAALERSVLDPLDRIRRSR